MSDPKSPLITRKDAAIYFANRIAVLIAFWCIAANAATLGIQLIYRRVEWSTLEQGVYFALKSLPFEISLGWLFGLFSGEDSWRTSYKQNFSAEHATARVVLALVCVAFMIWGDAPIWAVAIAGGSVILFIEIHFYRLKQTWLLAQAPSKVWVGFTFIVALLCHFAFIVTNRLISSDLLVMQHALVIGSILIYEFFACTNILHAWRVSGRLQPDANPRFQIHLSTILLIVCGLGLWGALLRWTFF